MAPLTSFPPRRDRVFLFALLLFFIAKSVFFSFVIPLGQGPDEEAHLDYAHWLAIKHTPPQIDDRLSTTTILLYGMGFPPLEYFKNAQGMERLRHVEQAEAEWRSNGYAFTTFGRQTEAGQPPLYYLTTAILTAPFRALSPISFWHLARLASVAFGVVAIVAAWRFCNRHFTGERLLIRGFIPALFALHPMASFIFSIVNNDAALIALSTIFFAQVVSRDKPWRCAITAALLLLTKASSIAAIAWWVLWMLASAESRERWKVALTAACSVVGIALWLLVANITRGETHYLTFARAVFPEAGAPLSMGEVISKLLHGVTIELWHDFGGVIGWLGMWMPSWWQAVRLLIIAIPLIALVVYRTKLVDISRDDKRMLIQSLSFVAMWWLLLTAGGFQALRWAGTHTLQGRMILPCLLPIMLALLIIMKNFAPARLAAQWCAGGIFLSVIGCVTMVLLLPARYYFDVNGWHDALGKFARGVSAAQVVALNNVGLWSALIGVAALCFVVLAALTGGTFVKQLAHRRDLPDRS